MDNHKNIDLTRVAAAVSPAAILLAQQRIGSDDGHMSSPTKDHASPDIPRRPRSTGEYSDRVRFGAIHSSTPQSQSIKYVTLTSDDDDPFSTPSQTDISGDRSLTTPSTAAQSTSSVEIFLGPQPLPFVHNRHRLLMDQYNPSPSRSRTKTGDLPSLLGRKSKSPAPPVSSSTTPAVQEPDTKNTAAVARVSKWRTEQLKKVKSPRIVPGSRERHIPLLHGPPSLPYSRNPSGVDATVADQSAYLSHVFGLRMANSPDGKASIKSSNPRSRVASDSTAARTVSSSSYLSTSTGYMSATTDNTSLSYASSGKRPVVVRDHNQIIGIKKEVVPIPAEQVPLTSLQLAQSLGALKPVDVRSQLGLGQPSPTKTKAAKAPQAQDEAIHSASSSAWPINPAEPTQIKATPAVFKTLTLVDPTTGQIYNVRVLQQQQQEAESRVVSGESALSSKLTTPPHAASSKADASINWRNKTSKLSPLQSILTAPPPTATSSPTVDAPVLTVDHLYEKFGHMKDVSDVTYPAPLVRTGDAAHNKTLSESTSGNANLPADAETPVKTTMSRRRGARQGKGRGKVEPATKAKGTPGAGKHLTCAHDNEIAPLPMSAPSTPSKSPPPRKPRSQRRTSSPKKAAAVIKT